MTLPPRGDAVVRSRAQRPRAKRYALGCLLGGLALALGTPVYVALAAPHLAGYLLHPALLLGQTVPYVLCGALWLPWRARVTAMPALVHAVLLLVAALIVYVPLLWSPGARGGDMVGLLYVGVSVAMTGTVLLGSAVALLLVMARNFLAGRRQSRQQA